MLLASGTSLGPYEILAPIGAGGMGEVYRARDTRLRREVAIKVAGERFSGRFQREAEAISSLNHPNICTLYDVGPNYLVMELVEGETLSAHLRKGPLRIDLALRYGQQIADGMTAAHARGIVHRDLKPGNIMITRNGIKILDFGLAKLAPMGDEVQTETLTASRAIVGTPAYMAPEQLEGKESDPRTDIFALGIVLYEMAAGKRPFAGDSQAALVADIMRAEAPAIPDAPPQFAHIVARCLAKDPANRWQSASDVRLELEWAGSSQAAPVSPLPRPASRRWLLGGVAVAALAIGIVGTVAWLRQATPEERVYRFSLAPPPDTEFLNVPNRTGLALSPDGHTLVFLGIRNGQSRLWAQRLDSQAARELAGTENAAAPFWSPDGRSVGFFAGGSLKRIDLDGSNLQVLTDIQAPRGAAWGADGTILFSPSNRVNTGLYRIPATGGKAVQVTTVDRANRETYHSHPVLLRDGRRFLYRTQGTAGAIYAGSFDDSKWKASVMPGSNWVELAHPSPSGPHYLVWNRGATIVAQTWDPASLHLSGEPAPLGGPVGVLAPYAAYTVSDSGLLVYAGPADLQLQWVDRTGKPLGVLGEPGQFGSPSLSPDGGKVAAQKDGTLVVIDVRRGVTSRIATSVGAPVWSPDSRRLAFGRGGRVVIVNADGTGTEALLPSSGGNQHVDAWTPDGRALLYSELGAEGRRSLRIAPIGSPGAARPLLNSTHDEIHAAVSADGQWLAYVTDESGRDEVYVQKLEGGPRTQVSSNGGNTPKWRRDGRELFYEARDGALVSASVKPGADRVELSAPQTLFALPATYVGGHSYDATPDGQRFLVMAPFRPRAHEPLTVVVNWPALLRK